MKITIAIDEDDPRFKKLIRFLNKLGGIETSDSDDDKGDDDKEDDGKNDRKQGTNAVTQSNLHRDRNISKDMALINALFVEAKSYVFKKNLGGESLNKALFDLPSYPVIARIENEAMAIVVGSDKTLSGGVSVSVLRDSLGSKPLYGIQGHGATLFSAVQEAEQKFNELAKKEK